MKLDKNDALIVVDLQPDFMPGGPLAVAGGDQIAAPIGALARRFTAAGALVVATQDFHPVGHISFASTHGGRPFDTIALYGDRQTLWPDHCVAGTPGAALDPALPDETIALILRKGAHPRVDSYSAFRENVDETGARHDTGLAAWLRARGVERLWVTGLARDVCVKWTALDGRAAGFAVTVLDDLTCAVDPGAADDVDAELARAGVSIADTFPPENATAEEGAR